MLSGLNVPEVDELCSANVDSQLIEYVKRITPKGSQSQSFSALLDAQTLGKIRVLKCFAFSPTTT
jgi:hypothetical protein